MTLARGEVGERHSVAAANAGVDLVHLSVEAMRGKPFGHGVGIKEGSIEPFRRRTNYSMKANCVWHVVLPKTLSVLRPYTSEGYRLWTILRGRHRVHFLYREAAAVYRRGSAPCLGGKARAMAHRLHELEFGRVRAATMAGLAFTSLPLRPSDPASPEHFGQEKRAG